MANERQAKSEGIVDSKGSIRSRTEEPTYSLALKYQGGQRLSPQVLVGASGSLAQRIVQVAEQNGVSVEDEVGFSHLLAQLERNKPIQQESFQIVAEVLTFLYGLEQSIDKGRHR